MDLDCTNFAATAMLRAPWVWGVACSARPSTRTGLGFRTFVTLCLTKITSLPAVKITGATSFLPSSDQPPPSDSSVTTEETATPVSPSSYRSGDDSEEESQGSSVTTAEESESETPVTPLSYLCSEDSQEQNQDEEGDFAGFLLEALHDFDPESADLTDVLA